MGAHRFIEIIKSHRNDSLSGLRCSPVRFLFLIEKAHWRTTKTGYTVIFMTFNNFNQTVGSQLIKVSNTIASYIRLYLITLTQNYYLELPTMVVNPHQPPSCPISIENLNLYIQFQDDVNAKLDKVTFFCSFIFVITFCFPHSFV